MCRDDRRPQVRLRLWLAMRACAELECPWQPAEQLQLYLAKLPHIPADCQVSEMMARPDEGYVSLCFAAQLSAIDELNLLREFGEGSTIVATRAEYLVAAIQAPRLPHLTDMSLRWVLRASPQRGRRARRTTLRRAARRPRGARAAAARRCSRSTRRVRSTRSSTRR